MNEVPYWVTKDVWGNPLFWDILEGIHASGKGLLKAFSKVLSNSYIPGFCNMGIMIPFSYCDE